MQSASRLALLVLLVLLPFGMSCKEHAAPSANGNVQGAQNAAADTQKATPAPAATPPPPPRFAYHSDADLDAAGAMDLGGKRLMCKSENSVCTCNEPLPCKQGECVDFETHLRRFKAELADKTPGRSVYCEHAETGKCGAFRYFMFSGDIERYEILWFDDRGLVAEEQRTDYEAYCDGKASARFLGPFPKCDKLQRTELLCGEASPEPGVPLQRAVGRRAGIATSVL